MNIDWKTLVSTLVELVAKVRAGTATPIDWVKAVNLITTAILAARERPVIGADGPAIDPGSASQLSAMYQDITGEQLPANGGFILSLVLPVIINYFLKQLTDNPHFKRPDLMADYVSEVLGELLN